MTSLITSQFDTAPKPLIPLFKRLIGFDYQSVRHCSKTCIYAEIVIGKFDYQSVRHCSKTQHGRRHGSPEFDYQSVRHCSKTTAMTSGTRRAFDYQSVRHCSKTVLLSVFSQVRFDYQSVRHCSKTYGAKSLLRGDGKTDWSRLSILKKILINSVFSLMLIVVIVLLIFKQNNMSSRIKNVLIEQFELIFRQKSFKVHKN